MANVRVRPYPGDKNETPSDLSSQTLVGFLSTLIGDVIGIEIDERFFVILIKGFYCFCNNRSLIPVITP